MVTDHWKAEYLAKARETEEQAEKANDESSKAEWLRIAAGYHALATTRDSPTTGPRRMQSPSKVNAGTDQAMQ